MNSVKLTEELYAMMRRNGNTLDKAYDSGIQDAIHKIHKLTTCDIEYCPRCLKIAELFEDDEG